MKHNNDSFQIDEFYLDLQQDGSKLRNMPEEDIIKNPFPGLRPFKTSEMDLFFGRKNQTSELLKKLEANKFVAVIGSSGTGKSSLVRAGLIPALFGGNISHTGSNWKIAICRPGDDPVKNLSVALSSIKAGNYAREEVLKENAALELTLRSSSYGMLEVKELLDEQQEISTNQNLLVIIDQFEELFRFDRKELKSKYPSYKNIEFDFVNLLLRCIPNAEISNRHSIYVVLTMRSEFLGECVKFKGLAEAINKSQYLVPQLEREQLKDVIVGPVHRAGKEIEAGLVELLINEIESEKLKDNLDQLPVLQHALMRTYDEAFLRHPENRTMRFEHYQAIGTMKEALSKHAQEIFCSPVLKKSGSGFVETEENGKKVLSKKQLTAKIIFQALTDAGSDQKGGRRPTELQNIYGILKAINVNEQEVNQVLSHFRESTTSFIVPPSNTKLYPGLILDISHESLMRNWPDLVAWMKEETDAAELYRKLNDNRQQFDKDGDTYIFGSLLKELQEWRDSGLYNSAWAKRYQKLEHSKPIRQEPSMLYNKNLDYLEKCQKKKEERVAKKQKEREEKVRRNRILAAVSVLAFVISSSLGLYAFHQGKTAQDAIKKRSLAEIERLETDRKLIKSEAESARLAEESKSRNAQAAFEREKNKVEIKLAKEKAEKLTAIAEAARLKSESAQTVIKSILSSSDKILALVNEPFYKSVALSSTTKNNYIDSLIRLSFLYNDPNKYKTLLSNLNTYSDIIDYAHKNPNVAFMRALQFNSKTKNVLSDSLLFKIAKNFVFNTQELNFLTAEANLSNTAPVLSPDGKMFAIKFSDTIKVYAVGDSKLSLLNKVPLRSQLSSFSYPLTFIHDTLLVVEDGKIYKKSLVDSASAQVTSLPDSLSYVPVPIALSPDASLLVTTSDDNELSISTIPQHKQLFKPIRLGFASNPIDNLSISNDNKIVIVKQQKDYWILKVDSLSSLEYINGLKSYLYAAFTPDKEAIITRLQRDFYLQSLKVAEIDKITFADVDSNIFKNVNFRSITLSPDWKRLLVSTQEETFYAGTNSLAKYYFRSSDNDSIFSFQPKEKDKTKTLAKAIFLSYLDNSLVYFNNNSNLVSLDPDSLSEYYSTLRIWEEYRGAPNISQLNTFKTKLPDTITNDLQLPDIIANINMVTNESLLRDAAKTALKRDNRFRRKETYHDLRTIFKRLADLNESKYILDFRTYARNYFLYYRDTVEYIEDLKNIIKVEERLLDTLDNKAIQLLSSDYWDLSWYCLFSKDYQTAITSASRGSELFQRNNGILTNLALGYLLSGDCENANSIYTKWKGQKYNSDERLFTNSFLGDLDDMEKKGLIPPEGKIYAHVKKVRQFLQGEITKLDCEGGDK